MRYILASEDWPVYLSPSIPERAQRSAELLDLAPVLSPVARPLRGDGAIVMPLRFTQELRSRS